MWLYPSRLNKSVRVCECVYIFISNPRHQKLRERLGLKFSSKGELNLTKTPSGDVLRDKMIHKANNVCFFRARLGFFFSHYVNVCVRDWIQSLALSAGDFPKALVHSGSSQMDTNNRFNPNPDGQSPSCAWTQDLWASDRNIALGEEMPRWLHSQRPKSTSKNCF